MNRWDQHFLNMCECCARMSKDPLTRVGAVIVGPDREVRSTGFNGLPRGIADTADRLIDRDVKIRLIVHAEINAVMNAARVGTPLLGCTLYLLATDDSRATWGGAPCTRCTVEIIQAGIGEVVSLPFKQDKSSKWLDDVALARNLLSEASVAYREVT